jgi:hypothetical protein
MRILSLIICWRHWKNLFDLFESLQGVRSPSRHLFERGNVSEWWLGNCSASSVFVCSSLVFEVFFLRRVLENWKINHLVKSFKMIFPEPFKLQFRRTSPSHKWWSVGRGIHPEHIWMNYHLTVMSLAWWFVRGIIPHRRPDFEVLSHYKTWN